MAGSYPDVPGRRMAYDLDGTVCLYIDSPTVTQYSSAQLAIINNESTDRVFDTGFGNYFSQKQWVLLFPELRDIVGCVLEAAGTQGISGFSTSPDTTNGLDGTWTNVTGGNSGNVGRPGFRTINAVNWTNVKGIRFSIYGTSANNNQYFAGLHLYGSRPQSDRLAFWNPTTDVELTGPFLDWGNMVNGATVTRQVRIKNLHAVDTANSIVVSINTLTDTNPTMATNHTFSANNSSFASTLNIGALAPGVISSVFYVKITAPSTGNLGVWSTRLVATPGSWT